jgi:hypothetical protein
VVAAALSLGASSLAPAATRFYRCYYWVGGDTMSASDVKAAAAAANTDIAHTRAGPHRRYQSRTENPPWTHWSRTVRCPVYRTG